MIHQSLIYRDKLGTEPMRSVWTERAMIQRWLDLEAAVTWAQGELGIVPARVAAKIVRNCTVDKVRPQAVAQWHARTGHVIVSLVKAFREAVPDVGEMFHFGLTTQDVLDTGLTLQIRDALNILLPDLFELERTVRRQALRHRRTVMAGRTEGQLAAPITLGYKLAVVDSELTDHIERLAQATDRLMWVTVSGATGVQSSFCHIAGERATERMVALVARRLGLAVPIVCMHHRTDRFSELGFVLAAILSTLGEIGMEIRDLQRSEVGELAEPWSSNQHSSSTMPQKQNPEVSEWLEGLAQLGRGHALSLLDVRQQHERDTSRVPSQLHALPNLFLQAAAAVRSANFVLGGLQVFPSRMRENLMMNGGLIMAEAVMLLLAKRSRRKVWAHQHCHDIAMRVARSRTDLLSALLADEQIARHLEASEVRRAFAPENYIGTAVTQTQRTAATCRTRCAALERALRGKVLTAAPRRRTGAR